MPRAPGGPCTRAREVKRAKTDRRVRCVRDRTPLAPVHGHRAHPKQRIPGGDSMNKIFGLVWSRSLQRLVVVSELASARGKQGGRSGGRRRPVAGAALLVCGLAIAWSGAQAQALIVERDGDACTVRAAGADAATPVDCAVFERASVGIDAVAGDGYFLADGAGDGSDTPTVSGSGALAAGRNSHAINNAATAVGADSVASGAGASAYGHGAMALGDASVAIGQGAVALSATNIALGNNAQALGNDNPTVATYNIAIGHDSLANYAYSTALGTGRSEEHTSELQSRENLVCR